jgi:hypothetical protein
MDDLAIGWRKDAVLKRRNLSFRISEEEADEQGDENAQKSKDFPPYASQKDG